MSFDLNIKKMLEGYPDTISQTDKLREILQQTALLGLARHHSNHLVSGEKLREQELHEKLRKRIDQIDWELAKADVMPFIQDRRQLDIWSKEFFHDLIKYLRVVDGPELLPLNPNFS